MKFLKHMCQSSILQMMLMVDRGTYFPRDLLDKQGTSLGTDAEKRFDAFNTI